ncbi:hypothetical protein LRS65_26945 (plasmid) [Bacillus cereus]|uniref:hypothetical protein n=1 Tax=Bacillus cereus TaxID=1396 RepID=UPI00211C62E7|nr:hypothetical protein [Bacillus cereus]UUN20250.1 hypothetical protein LRS65_26945 [Bacillus cereus]
MTATYKDVVYRTSGPNELVWCEYKARFHTLVEVRYQVRVYEATEEFAPDRIFRKGHHIVDSSWKKTPKKAREDIEDEVGDLTKEHILWEDNFSISIPIIDEEF